MKSFEDIRTPLGVNITDYDGLTPRQRKNLEGLWKDRTGTYSDKNLFIEIPTVTQYPDTLKVSFRHGIEYEFDLVNLHGGDDGYGGIDDNLQVAIQLQALYRRANLLYNTYLEHFAPRSRKQILHGTLECVNGERNTLFKKILFFFSRERALYDRMKELINGPDTEYRNLVHELMEVEKEGYRHTDSSDRDSFSDEAIREEFEKGQTISIRTM